MEAATTILTGENFAEKAREMSSDEKAKDGGDWGYWGWQNFSSQERSMIDNLKQGEVSSPIDVQQAFSILFASEKVEERQETYGEVKARISGLLENEQLKKLAADKIARLYAKVKEANDLKQGEDKQKTPLLASGLLALGDSIKNIDEMGYISQKLFSLRENEIAPPMEFPEGFAIVQLTRIVKPEVEPFEKAKDRVKTQLLAAKKLQLQLAKARAVSAELQKLADDKKIAAYLAKENLKPENVTYQRGNQLSAFPVQPGLDDIIFTLGENAYSQPLTFGSEAAVIVKLKSKKVVSAEEFAKQKDEYYRKKLAEAKNSMFGSYIMSRRNEHKISFNAEIFEKIKEYAISRFR
jgi:parvulin-like peptidyl-prolyl isomerase